MCINNTLRNPVHPMSLFPRIVTSEEIARRVAELEDPAMDGDDNMDTTPGPAGTGGDAESPPQLGEASGAVAGPSTVSYRLRKRLRPELMAS